MADFETQALVALGGLVYKLTTAAIPAMIAQERGRPFWLWYFWGLLSFVIATLVALLLKPTAAAIERNRQKIREASRHEDGRICPGCGELMRPEIEVCGLCGAQMDNAVALS